MPEPLDVEAVQAEVERLRAETVPRSALVQVGWRHEDAGLAQVCPMEPEAERICWTCGRELPCAEPTYVIRTDSEESP